MKLCFSMQVTVTEGEIYVDLAIRSTGHLSRTRESIISKTTLSFFNELLQILHKWSKKQNGKFSSDVNLVVNQEVDQYCQFLSTAAYSEWYLVFLKLERSHLKSELDLEQHFPHRNHKWKLNLKLVGFSLFILRVQNTPELSEWEDRDGVLNNQDGTFWKCDLVFRVQRKVCYEAVNIIDVREEKR